MLFSLSRSGRRLGLGVRVSRYRCIIIPADRCSFNGLALLALLHTRLWFLLCATTLGLYLAWNGRVFL